MFKVNENQIASITYNDTAISNDNNVLTEDLVAIFTKEEADF